MDDEVAQAFWCMAVVDHLLQAPEVMGFALLVIDGDIDEVFLRHGILRRVEQDAGAWFAIAAGASCFLIVGFDVLGHVVMDDVAYVALVNAHTESISGDDDLDVIVEKVILGLGALLFRHTGMIAANGEFFLGQQFVDLVSFLARSGINDAGFVGMVADVVYDEFFLVFAAAYFEIKIRTVKTRDMHLGRVQPEQADDILLDLGGSRGCESSDKRAAWQAGDEGRNLTIAWAEVMAPL